MGLRSLSGASREDGMVAVWMETTDDERAWWFIDAQSVGRQGRCGRRSWTRAGRSVDSRRKATTDSAGDGAQGRAFFAASQLPGGLVEWSRSRGASRERCGARRS